jgi:hypothetical protein
MNQPPDASAIRMRRKSPRVILVNRFEALHRFSRIVLSTAVKHCR